MSGKFHVQVSIPSGKEWHPAFAQSLQLMTHRFTAVDPLVPIAFSTCHDEGGKYTLSRRDLVRTAREQRDPSVTHMLFMDPDIQFPAETLYRLFEYGLPVVGAKGKPEHRKWSCDETDEVDLGCAMVSLEALDVLGDEAVDAPMLRAPSHRGMLHFNHDLAREIVPAGRPRKITKRRQVAIIGKAKHCRIAAPFFNPNWEIWGLGFDRVPRIDRRFELHNEALLDTILEGDTVRDRIKSDTCPVIMQRVHEDIPNSRRYPLEAIVKDLGVDYFGSTFGLMLGMAIHEKVDKIGIWGVDLNTSEEYGYQKPNAEFLIGMALGRDIDVYLPPRTSLLTAPGRYGWDEDAYVKQIKLAHEAMERIVMNRVSERVNADLAKAFGEDALIT